MLENIGAEGEFEEESDLDQMEQRLDEFFIILPFLQWLEQPDESPQTVLDKIQHFDPNSEIDWDFTDTQPAIERLSPKQQQIAYAFVDFFQKKISYSDLLQLFD
jgi:hypothetical protein